MCHQSVETAAVLGGRVAGEAVAQREMPTQPEVPATTIAAPNVVAPTAEVPETAQSSVETYVPSVAVVSSEAVAQREMLSQPDASETAITAPNVVVPAPDIADTAPPSVEIDVPSVAVGSSEPVAQREVQPPPPISFPNDLPAVSPVDQRPSESEPSRAQYRETNVLDSPVEAVNNWADNFGGTALRPLKSKPPMIWRGSQWMCSRRCSQPEWWRAPSLKRMRTPLLMSSLRSTHPVDEERFTGAYLPPDADDAGDTGDSTFPTPSVDVYTALRAMGLVPAARGSESKQASIQRSPQPEGVAYAAPAPPMQREPLAPAIQREINEVDAFNPDADDSEAELDFDQADLEQLARDVYRVLKDRLRIESERGRRR